jgi:hypothetical protein
VTTVVTVLVQLASKVRSWQFSRQLARAEKRQLSIDIIANHAEQNWNVGMMALFGVSKINKPTHKDWKK